ncbi:hypothetical protein [Burkholderia seminalis]|uniref:hypothetical protein n=1 Tax=Burkholderia seminalis TaxID=488731 RepID=UPI00264D5869|nr:hypothetical protein [Burkholderia seminalis]MDN7850690.1 hypothetical protein [Burkholderia seminalis]
MPAFASITVAAPDVLDKVRLRAWLKASPRTMPFARWIVRGGQSPREAAGAMVFIGIFHRATQAVLRDGIVQRSVAAGTVATTSNVD